MVVSGDFLKYYQWKQAMEMSGEDWVQKSMYVGISSNTCGL